MKIVKLGNVVKIVKGKKAYSVFDVQKEGMVRFIQIDDLRNDNKLKFTDKSGVFVKSDDVIIAWDGANAGTVGYGLNGIIGSTLAKLEIQNDGIYSKYLGKFLQSKFHYLRDGCTGATIPHISKQVLTNLKVSLPSLEDQKRIVKILDEANSLHQKRKQAIEHLDDYLKSTFLDMFGDPVKNPKGWKTKKIGEMIDFMTSGSRGWAKYYSESGDVFLRIQNVGRNNLLLNDICYVQPPRTAESLRTKVQSGDILLSITADLGRTAVIPDTFANSYISQHLALLRLKKEFMPEYVAEFLSSQGGKIQIERLNKGGTKAGLNFADVRSLNIPQPDKDLQSKYLDVRNKLLSLKQKMLTQSVELENQFQALMQKAFKGAL